MSASSPVDPGVWSVIALSGGSSSRMGRDKATVELAGKTLLEWTLAGVPESIPIVVVGPTIPLGRRADFCQEEPAGGGPVAGIVAGLELVRTPLVVVLATDLPFVGNLPRQLALALSSADPVDAVIPVDEEGRQQQLCAAYRVAALHRAVRAIGTGSGASMRSVVARLTSITWDSTASGVAVRDVDTPEDLAVARTLVDDTGGQGTTTPSAP